MTVFSFLTYVLWLVFCRHGVIHTQSLQKLLLEDDVTKPGGKIQSFYYFYIHLGKHYIACLF